MLPYLNLGSNAADAMPKAGDLGYIAKPYQFTELLNRVRDILDK